MRIEQRYPPRRQVHHVTKVQWKSLEKPLWTALGIGVVVLWFPYVLQFLTNVLVFALLLIMVFCLYMAEQGTRNRRR
jgi:hypothetical protein